MRKTISFILALALLLNLSVLAYADNEPLDTYKGVTIVDGVILSVTNVVSENTCQIDGLWDTYKTFTAVAPAKITFENESGRQGVYSSESWKANEDGTFTIGINDQAAYSIDMDYVQYEIYNYDIDGWITVNNLPEDYYDEYSYGAGSYTVLDKPGVYLVFLSGPATAGSYCIINVIEGTTTDSSAELDDEAYAALGSNIISITNVSEQSSCSLSTRWGNYTCFTASSPAKVTLKTNAGIETISYSADWTLDGSEAMVSEENTTVEYINPDYAQYKLFDENGERVIVDAIPEDYDGEYTILAGTYTTLTKPGIYLVRAANLAESSGYCVIKIVPGNEDESTAAIFNDPIEASEAITAVPASSKVIVDGREVVFQAYNLNGNNYFKLRDIAMVLSGSNKQFEVSWDKASNAISLTAGMSYTSVGGELKVSDNPSEIEAIPTTSKLYLDGQEVHFTSYNIGGNNYFKLRDIGKALNFGIDWNGETRTITIDTTAVYTE